MLLYLPFLLLVGLEHLALANPSTPLPGPFPQQEPQVDEEIDSLVFMRKLFASKAVMYFLLRSHDENYSRLTADNQQLLLLNQELTQTAERQHKQLQELAANLAVSAAAYKEKIAALEQQIGFTISRKSWVRKWFDRMKLIYCSFDHK